MSRSTPTRCAVVADDRLLAAQLTELLERMPGAECAGVTEPAAMRAGRLPVCDVVLVCSADAALAGEVAVSAPAAGMVVVARNAGVEAYREALAAGARALVPAPPTREELAAAVVEAARAARPAARPSGRVTALCGAKGGVGTSMLAVALALTGSGTLVDLADGRAPLDELLGHRSEATIADLTPAGHDLDAAIEAITQRHPSGLRLVAGPGRERLELLPDGLVGAMLLALRRAHPHSVVDAGCALAPAAREALVAADRLLIVTTADVQSAAAARAQLLALGRFGVDTSDAAIVVNRWSRKAELTVRVLERACVAPAAAVIDEDAAAAADFANARIRPDDWPHRRLRRALAGLVDTNRVAA